VNCKDGLIDDCCKRHAIEAIIKNLPQLYAMSSFAIVVKAINPVDRCTFMVATQYEEILWMLYLEGKKKTDSF
jgi:hypothetical protein